MSKKTGENRFALRRNSGYNGAIMHISPALTLFDHLFHAFADLCFLVAYIILTVLVARSPQQRLHLRWILPHLAATVLVVVFRIIIDVHYYFGLRYDLATVLWYRWCLYGANMADLYGVVVMILIFRRILRNLPPGSNLLKLPVEEWPAPPTSTPNHHH